MEEITTRTIDADGLGVIEVTFSGTRVMTGLLPLRADSSLLGAYITSPVTGVAYRFMTSGLEPDGMYLFETVGPDEPVEQWLDTGYHDPDRRASRVRDNLLLLRLFASAYTDSTFTLDASESGEWTIYFGSPYETEGGGAMDVYAIDPPALRILWVARVSDDMGGIRVRDVPGRDVTEEVLSRP